MQKSSKKYATMLLHFLKGWLHSHFKLVNLLGRTKICLQKKQERITQFGSQRWAIQDNKSTLLEEDHVLLEFFDSHFWPTLSTAADIHQEES